MVLLIKTKKKSAINKINSQRKKKKKKKKKPICFKLFAEIKPEITIQKYSQETKNDLKLVMTLNYI